MTKNLNIENQISGIRSELNRISGFQVSGFFGLESDNDFHYPKNQVSGFPDLGRSDIRF